MNSMNATAIAAITRQRHATPPNGEHPVTATFRRHRLSPLAACRRHLVLRRNIPSDAGRVSGGRSPGLRISPLTVAGTAAALCFPRFHTPFALTAFPFDPGREPPLTGSHPRGRTVKKNQSESFSPRIYTLG